MERAPRLLRLLHLLDSRRARGRGELCDELGISERSLYRDLATLEEYGTRIDQAGGCYRLVESQRSIVLSEQERAVLQLLLASPSLRHDEGMRNRLDSLASKLKPSVDGITSGVTLADLERTGKLGSGVMQVIDDAIAKQHTLRIDYVSLSGKGRRTRRLDPLIAFHRGEAWYLAGHCHENRAPRMFRLDRIASAASTGDVFLRAKEFDVKTWLADAWNVWTGEEKREIVVHFDADIAPLIEHAKHHEGESIAKRFDGSLVYRVTLSHLEEVARWIVTFGGKARAVEPKELVDRVRDIAEEVLVKHGEATASRPRSAAAKTARLARKRE